MAKRKMKKKPAKKAAKRKTARRAKRGPAELIISKQRNGPIGKVHLSFIGNLTKFENLAPERYSDFGPLE